MWTRRVDKEAQSFKSANILTDFRHSASKKSPINKFLLYAFNRLTAFVNFEMALQNTKITRTLSGHVIFPLVRHQPIKLCGFFNNRDRRTTFLRTTMCVKVLHLYSKRFVNLMTGGLVDISVGNKCT